MKRVHTARHLTEAHLLADLLEAEGIPAATRSTNYGSLSFAHIWDPPSVWIVEGSDLERATRFVEEFSRRSPEQESAATWRCDKCGEHIEEQFDACWKCSGQEDAPSSEGPESRSPSVGPILRRLALALGTLFLLLGLIGLYGFLYGGGDVLLYGGVGALNPIMILIPTLLAVGFVLLILGAGAQAVGHPISLGFFITGLVLLAFGQVGLLVEDSILWVILLLMALAFGVLFTFVGGGLLLFFRFTRQSTQAPGEV